MNTVNAARLALAAEPGPVLSSAPISAGGQLPQKFTYAVCIDAEIALADTRLRAHVNTAAATRGRDANDDIVLEGEQQRGVRGLDAQVPGRHGDDLPSHGARRALGTRERVRWRQVEHRGRDVGGGLLLLRRGPGAVIGRVLRARSGR